MSPPPRALFVTDLDHTLLGPDRTLPARNRDAIAAAAASGIVIAIVTGRRASMLAAVLPLLAGLRFRAAASNGAVLLAADNHEVEAVVGLDWALALEVAGRDSLRTFPVLCITAPAPGDGGEVHILAGGSRRWHVSPTAFRRETWRDSDGAVALARTLVHVAIVIDDRAHAERLAEDIRAGLAGRASVHVVRHPIEESGALLELVPPGGKGIAVRALGRQLGIPYARTGAIGDEANDADLLDAAAHRYAVGGSVLARRRPDASEVGPCGDGAVADALARFLGALARQSRRG